MGIHSNAWEGIRLSILGESPLLPMRIEQAIAFASPANELRVESFEEYSEAYDHARNAKNVGLVFIVDDLTSAPLSSILKNMSSIRMANSGLPCLGVILAKEAPKPDCYRAMSENKNLIAYLPVGDILDSSVAPTTMSALWTTVSDTISTYLIPDALAKVLVSLAEASGLTRDSIHFMERTTNLLTSKLNVSWLEEISLQWAQVLGRLSDINSPAISNNSELLWLLNFSKPDFKMNDLSEGTTRSSHGLAARITAYVTILDKHRLEGNLEESLLELKKNARPDSPALSKIVCKEAAKILEFSGAKISVHSTLRQAG